MNPTSIPSQATRRPGEAGFSLVELAIVLIIIGIILGAVTKGRDLIRSSEQKKIYTQFVNAWAIAYQTYHDRTGLVLGDNIGNSGRDGLVDTGASITNIITQLRSAGVEVPPGLGSGAEGSIIYQDSLGNPNTLQLTFASNTTWGNYMQLKDNTRGIPFELGQALDTLVDGSANGQQGSFLYSENVSNGTTLAWPPMADANGNATAVVAASAAIWRMPF